MSQEIGCINPTLNTQLLHLTQRRIPIENLITQQNLSPRQKQLLNVQSIIASQLGDKNYVGIFYALPHLQEPDLVFGHLGAIPLSIPQDLTEGEPCSDLGQFIGPGPAWRPRSGLWPPPLNS